MKPGRGWQSGQALHELDEFQGMVSHIQDAVGGILEFSVSFNVMFSSFTENLSKPLWQAVRHRPSRGELT